MEQLNPGVLVPLPEIVQDCGEANVKDGPLVAQLAVSCASSRLPGPLLSIWMFHCAVSPTPTGFVARLMVSAISARLSAKINNWNASIACAPARSVAVISTLYGVALTSASVGVPDRTPVFSSMPRELPFGSPLTLNRSRSPSSPPDPRHRRPRQAANSV